MKVCDDSCIYLPEVLSPEPELEERKTLEPIEDVETKDPIEAADCLRLSSFSLGVLGILTAAVSVMSLRQLISCMFLTTSVWAKTFIRN